MRAEPLLDAFAKTEWAETAIHDLHDSIKTFFQPNPYEMRSNLNDDGSRRVWRFVLTRKPPRSLSVSAGAILYALRTPLDQMVAAIVSAAGKSQTGVSFVFGDTPDKFTTELGKMKKLTPELRELMRETKPYPGGDDVLWALHKLNRGDKHRVGLVPLMMPATTRMSYLRFDYGLPFHVGCHTGKHLNLDAVRVPNHVLLRPPTALYDVRPGSVEFGDSGSPGDESLEFMTTTPHAQFETDFQPALQIGFDHVAVHGQPITDVFNDMRQAVERVLRTFERRFF
jgi:hypothetical protein